MLPCLCCHAYLLRHAAAIYADTPPAAADVIASYYARCRHFASCHALPCFIISADMPLSPLRRPRAMLTCLMIRAMMLMLDAAITLFAATPLRHYAIFELMLRHFRQLIFFTCCRHTRMSHLWPLPYVITLRRHMILLLRYDELMPPCAVYALFRDDTPLMPRQRCRATLMPDAITRRARCLPPCRCF